MAMEGDKMIENGVFEAAAEWVEVDAELQVARLRLEAAESEKRALAAELASVQGRLHDSLEVLEGLLAERSQLMKQTHELWDQLEVALEDRRDERQAAASPAAAPAAGSPPLRMPRLQLKQELLLAQAQLAELRQQQQAWQAERQALLCEVEEERQRLQEGLAEALTKATSAQLEADAAAERASHWCTLAQLLQRSALLVDSPSPLSPASLASRYSPGSVAARSCSKSHASLAQLLAERCSPRGLRGRVGSAGNASPGCKAVEAVGVGGAEEVPGLMAAFNAAGVTDDSEAQCSPGAAPTSSRVSPLSLAPQRARLGAGATPPAGCGGTGPASALASTTGEWALQSTVQGAPRAPLSAAGAQLLVKQLPFAGVSSRSTSSGGSPPTPAPYGAPTGKALTTPASDGSTVTATSCQPWRHHISLAEATPTSGSRNAGRRGAGKPGFLGRLLCAAALPAGPAQEVHSRLPRA